MGVNVVQRKVEVLGVLFSIAVADGEMFSICMRKLDNISVRQTYRWKARFVGFLAMAIYSV